MVPEEESPHEMDMVIPQWCFEILPPPDAEKLKKDENERAAIEDIYHDTLNKHKILEQYPGIRATGPCNLIKAISIKIIRNIRDNKGGKGIQSMQHAMSLVEDDKDFNLYRIDQTVRMACESAVLNAFWRFVRHEDHVESPADLLSRWDNFKKERSHWWRAKRVLDSKEVVQKKWDTLLQDSINLLHFHNVLLHSKCLLEKPTLKHTLHLSALTVEGRVYENGQGRSIASECRHIMVRKECNIPIKTRPDRKEPKVQTKRTTVGPPKGAFSSTQSIAPTTVSPDNGSNGDMSYDDLTKDSIMKRRKMDSSNEEITGEADGSSSSTGRRHSVKPDPDLTDDALSLLFFRNTATSPHDTMTTSTAGSERGPTVANSSSAVSDFLGKSSVMTENRPHLMRADSSSWAAQLGGDNPANVPVVSGRPYPFSGEGRNDDNGNSDNNSGGYVAPPPLMRLTSKDWPKHGATGVPTLNEEVQSVFIMGKQG